MKAFLITYKPATENPERGWPIEELRRLVKTRDAGQKAVEPWRFKNRKDVELGDRVFLLLQGKGGPAIIGYGEIIGKPKNSADGWDVPVQFESIVDPTVKVLANRDNIKAIQGGEHFWRSQASGVLLSEAVADELEALVVGATPKPIFEKKDSNPDWERDELIIVLNFYLQHRSSPPSKTSFEIRKLSDLIRRLGKSLHPGVDSYTFRNENGVYTKLMNFRSLDPKYTLAGKVGLSHRSKADREVWTDFATDPSRCRQVADAIIASLDMPEASALLPEGNFDDGLQEAPEGRLLTRMHVTRERNHRLVEQKRKNAMSKYGKLVCEACEFDFVIHYGERGRGFIECHHTKPVFTLPGGHKTHLNDLALVCANCHRIIHRDKRWLSIAELKLLLNDACSKALRVG